MTPGIISKPKEDITNSRSADNGTDQKDIFSPANDVPEDNIYDTMDSSNKWSLSDSVRNARVSADSGRFNLNTRKKIIGNWTYK
ncbi:hypothetical protein DdX_12310 [Ditylenchus destructor]|uniref:Uncharacterized protein n=1 Tax=Ditylenchus destructor TaxID=166010 RepID=A0AAD4R0K2_9BILA|nr:hypothetical protein DdX_12310 [Ditylenchus destructor]